MINDKYFQNIYIINLANVCYNFTIIHTVWLNIENIFVEGQNSKIIILWQKFIKLSINKKIDSRSSNQKSKDVFATDIKIMTCI